MRKKKNNILWWSIKLGFETTPLFYSLLIITNILNIIIPILTTFILAIIVNLLIHALIIHSKVLTFQIIFLIILGLLLRVLQNIIYELNSYFISRINYKWEIVQVSKFLEKLSSLDLEHRENQDINLLSTKIRENMGNAIRYSIVVSLPSVLAQLIGLVTIGGIFFILDPIFILLILIPIIINFLIDRKYGNEVYSLWFSKGEDKIISWKANLSLQDVSTYKESKVYNIFNYIIDKYKNVNENFQKTAISKLKDRTKLLSFSYIIDGIIFGVIQIWIIQQTLIGSISIGLYSFYILNLSTIIDNLKTLGHHTSLLISDMKYIEDYRDFLEIPNLIQEKRDPILIDFSSPEIEFRNVSFKYPNTERYILKNISFKINKGEKVAIVGRNGVGKSTLIKLLARFYDVNRGEILINSINIQDIDLKSYYDLWGVLFQEYSLFWFSIRENIALSNIKDINNIELIKQAANKADIDNEIDKLPHQYQSLLHTDLQKGVNLSGGQKQKIGIARALFRNPKFIILDEPTSALDSLSEEKIFNNIYKNINNSTTLIVSHKFSTVKNADNIILMKDGKIDSMGNHEYLMKNNKFYNKMFMSQAKHYQ